MDARELYARHAQVNTYTRAQSESVSVRTRDVVRAAVSAVKMRGRSCSRAVELGIGDGELSCELARAFGAARVLGVDIAAERVADLIARAELEGLAAQVEGAVLDASTGLAQLVGPPADLIVAIDVMEHVFDVFGFVDGLVQATAMGGTLILRVPNVAYIKRRAELLLGELPVTSSWFGPRADLTSWRNTWGWDGGHLHFFTRHTLDRLLTDAGFRVVRHFDPGASYGAVRSLLPGLLLGNLGVVAERVR